jgi:HAMP domain-containing protein
MATHVSTSGDFDFEEIEAAVLESERGRWFLAEYARRNRNADTDRLLDAIRRIEASMPAEPSPVASGEVDRVRRAICEMADEIASLRREIAAIGARDQDDDHHVHAPAELDAIADSTKRATSEILGAAEQVQEIVRTLRELGTSAELCHALDERAMEIHTACSVHDVNARRTGRIVRVLQLLEARTTAMAQLWSGSAPPDPTPAGSTGDHASGTGPDRADIDDDGIDQDSVERMMDEMDAVFEEADGAADSRAPPTQSRPAEPFGQPGEAVADQRSEARERGAPETDLSGLKDKDYEALFS